MLRGNLPRSPVWLRKIPSTVSGSQGSRRGLRPAVRFAFPLGAKMYITDFPALGQGKVRIRTELFRRAGGFRRIVGVSPGRAIVTDGPLPPILVEESPQPGERCDAREQRALVAAGHERHAVARDPDAVASATAKTAISANEDWPFAPPYARQSRHRIFTNSATARGTVAAYWKAAASGSPTGPSRPAPRALRGTGVPHHPRHPPGGGGLLPWIPPCGLGKRQ